MREDCCCVDGACLVVAGVAPQARKPTGSRLNFDQAHKALYPVGGKPVVDSPYLQYPCGLCSSDQHKKQQELGCMHRMYQCHRLNDTRRAVLGRQKRPVAALAADVSEEGFLDEGMFAPMQVLDAGLDAMVPVVAAAGAFESMEVFYDGEPFGISCSVGEPDVRGPVVVSVRPPLVSAVSRGMVEEAVKEFQDLVAEHGTDLIHGSVEKAFTGARVRCEWLVCTIMVVISMCVARRRG